MDIFGERKAMSEIPKIQPTYIVFKRKDAIHIQNPISYSKIISNNEEQKIETVMLKETDEVIEIKLGREFKINEKLLMIHRYIHNDLNLSYKDVLDIEIIYTEKKLDDNKDNTENETSRIAHRYPNEGRSAVDFQATILDTFIDCELRRENIINNDKKMYVMVLICSNPEERKVIGELVNRYLFIEDREAHLSQQSSNRISRSYPRTYHNSYNPLFGIPRMNDPFMAPSYNPLANIASLFNMFGNTGSNSFWSQPIPRAPPQPPQPPQPPTSSFHPLSSLISSTMGPISSAGSEISSGTASSSVSDEQKTDYERKIQELDRQREAELNEIRQMFFQDRDRPIQAQPAQPSQPPVQNRQPSIHDIFGEGDYEITYMFSNPFASRQVPPMSLMGNMMNLLRFVNGVGGDDNVIFENLMEPVRVTVSDDKMNVFLTSFKYDTKAENTDIKIKDQDTCSICLSKYEKDEAVSYLNTCNHLFHTTCIDKWLRDFNHKCPVCRMSADPSKNESEKPLNTEEETA